MLSRAFVYLVEAKISSNLDFRAFPSLRGLQVNKANEEQNIVLVLVSQIKRKKVTKTLLVLV